MESTEGSQTKQREVAAVYQVQRKAAQTVVAAGSILAVIGIGSKPYKTPKSIR